MAKSRIIRAVGLDPETYRIWKKNQSTLDSATNNGMHYTAAETAYLLDSASPDTILMKAKKLGRSYYSAQRHITNLRALQRKRAAAPDSKPYFSPEEDQLILSNSLSPLEMAELMGRTVISIKTRRRKLRAGTAHPNSHISREPGAPVPLAIPLDAPQYQPPLPPPFVFGIPQANHKGHLVDYVENSVTVTYTP